MWEDEDGFEPLRQGRARGRGVLEISEETRPGVLEAIDKRYYEVAYPIREPDEDNLPP